MGYITVLNGVIKVSPRVQGPQLQYLRAFTNCRHMRLNVKECERLADPLRRAVDLPAGLWTIPDTFAPSLVLDTSCPGMRYIRTVLLLSGTKPKAYDAWLEFLATLMKYWGHDLQGSIQYEGKILETMASCKSTQTWLPISGRKQQGKL